MFTRHICHKSQTHVLVLSAGNDNWVWTPSSRWWVLLFLGINRKALRKRWAAKWQDQKKVKCSLAFENVILDKLCDLRRAPFECLSNGAQTGVLVWTEKKTNITHCRDQKNLLFSNLQKMLKLECLAGDVWHAASLTPGCRDCREMWKKIIWGSEKILTRIWMYSKWHETSRNAKLFPENERGSKFCKLPRNHVGELGGGLNGRTERPLQITEWQHKSPPRD